MRDIRRILVPVDYSECSRAALECAVLLAERFGSSIDLLHVFEPPHYVGPEFLIREPGETGHPVEQAARTQAEKEMSEFIAQVPGRDRFRVRLVSGKPVETVVRIADEEQFDAIVMGTHGRTGLQHVVLGSVAERVVRTATCPVMTIRQPGAARAAVERSTAAPPP